MSSLRTSISFAWALALLPSCGEPTEPTPRERIVLITLDTLRGDSFLGSEARESSMPLTRAWAREGVVFENYYSASSSTQPTHATLFTGLHPWQHGVSHNGTLLREEHLVLAEQMRAAGYRTGAAVASYPVHSKFGYAQGFDQFHDGFNRGQDWDQWVGREVEAEGGFFASGDFVVDQALRLIEELGGEKQFLWLHFFDPHSPYGDRAPIPAEDVNVPVPLQLRRQPDRSAQILARAREQYELDVAALDTDLQHVFQRLQRDSTETHVIVVSDHGESFGEAGAQAHGKRLTPEQVLVPLIVHSPRLRPGVRSDPVGSIDVTATLLSLAGIEARPTGSLDLFADAPGEEHQVFGMRQTFKRGTEERVNEASHALSADDNRFFAVVAGQLYTGNSGAVTVDDYGPAISEGDRLRHLRDLFAGFENELRATMSTSAMDDESQSVLEALGYTGND